MEPQGIILGQNTATAEKKPSARAELEQLKAVTQQLSDGLNTHQSAISHHGQTIDQVINEFGQRLAGLEAAVMSIGERMGIVEMNEDGQPMLRVDDTPGPDTILGEEE